MDATDKPPDLSVSSPAPSAETSTQNTAVMNILLRDALALRQPLFSYLQFYLTAQAGLAVLFGIVAHDSYDVVQMPSAKQVLLLSVLGLLASFLVIAYGIFVLRPGSDSRDWIVEQLKQADFCGDTSPWVEAFHDRLQRLLSANETLSKKVTWIWIGILVQLACGFIVFVLSWEL